LSLLTRKSESIFEQEGSIELEEFPKTICDAIELCRELGERYLWVDSMCITQDSEDKYNQLKVRYSTPSDLRNLQRVKLLEYASRRTIRVQLSS